jgi:hypothetical protein
MSKLQAVYFLLNQFNLNSFDSFLDATCILKFQETILYYNLMKGTSQVMKNILRVLENRLERLLLQTDKLMINDLNESLGDLGVLHIDDKCLIHSNM